MAAAMDPPTGNGSADPFTTSPTQQPGPLRYAKFDNDDFSLYSSSSPSHARRALEAHLKDTDRRIQDASKLGSALLQQRKELSARLKDVDELDKDNEVPDSLRQKLAELEKEYDAVGRESARAFLPKSRNVSEGTEKAVLSASGRESPTKLSAPSRKQRNQPTNRIHDIEFATEISTSLLAQVRQLQAALAEKDDALKDSSSTNANLENELESVMQRVRRLDESEQKYKDENWNLETRLQELEASMKEIADREHRLGQSLKSTESEKSAAQRDLDSLKMSHDQLTEQHALIKKQQEGDMHGLRRDLTSHQLERDDLQKKVAELTAQNTELAKAVSYRFNQPSAASDHEFVTADEEDNDADVTPDHSEPVSPVKGTPRHGMLESETLKSSLNHAHRMIQNLKNNIHREKTEKIELKRMLQDARDELETRRGDGANVAKKRRSEPQFKKPNRPDRLGANKTGTTEYLDDDDWEDDAGARTPSKSTFGGAALFGGLAAAGGAAAFAHKSEPDSTDAFETATERGGTTESEAFETGNEGPTVDDSDELTETEGTVNRNGTMKQSTSSLKNAKAGDRTSFFSTASTSADEADKVDDDATRTPAQTQQQQRYRLRMARGGKRGGRVADLMSDSPSTIGNHSPASSFGTPQPAGQSLGDELDALDDESLEGTPSRTSESMTASPETTRQVTVEPDTPRTLESPFKNSVSSDRPVSAYRTQPVVQKPPMVDAGIMTEPWEPEKIIITEPPVVPSIETEDNTLAEPGKVTPEKHSFRNRAGEVMGGALAGFGLGRLGRGKDRSSAEPASRGVTPEPQTETQPEADSTRAMAVVAAREALIKDKSPTAITSTGHEISASPAQPEALHVPEVSTVQPLPVATLSFSSIESQDYEPIPVRPVEHLPGVAAAPIPGTDAAKPGAALFASGAAVAVAGEKVFEDKAAPEVATSKHAERTPLGEIQPNVVQNSVTAPQVTEVKKPMTDEGVQTMVSGNDIDKMLRAKPTVDTAASPIRGSSRFVETGINEPVSPKVPRRPGSANSMRKTTVVVAPPLPEDHTLKIAQAQRDPPAATAGSMGPPAMPASAYRQQPGRPRTPAERASERTSKDGTTPRPPRMGRAQIGSPSNMSRRSSVSSFASEIDQRFNRGQFMYPADVEPSTDPRMIQAITQTMIGEYLWKYTRKAGRSETSSTRHRRFFWVHPYTRTLYWSETDPSAAGKNMLKAKSVAIEAVRVVTDDNTMPPGLHRKSIVIITPGREVVFTAPTGQRHETWYNALSYLLLRSDREKAEAKDTFNQQDIDEFNPSFSIRRSISKMTGRDRSASRMSMSSYNSRTTRTSSPQRGGLGSSHGAARSSLNPNATSTASSRQPEARQSSGAFSSIASKFRPGSSHHRGSVNTATRGRSSTSLGRRAGDPAEIYDASVVADSAEDLRAVIERQEQEADGLENVRACCDGKHDVGSLPNRKGRHSSFGNRLSHSHANLVPNDSTRSRT